MMAALVISLFSFPIKWVSIALHLRALQSKQLHETYLIAEIKKNSFMQQVHTGVLLPSVMMKTGALQKGLCPPISKRLEIDSKIDLRSTSHLCLCHKVVLFRPFLALISAIESKSF